MSLDPIRNEAFWYVVESEDLVDEWIKYMDKDPDIGLLNSSEVENEICEQYDDGGEEGWWEHGMRHEYFNHLPQLRLPVICSFDYISHRGYKFVSPRLFTLLDQPRGTLQGLKTETTWLGHSPPDWSYLWLSFIPMVSAIDTDLVHPRDLIIRRYGRGENGLVHLNSPKFMPLRDDIDTPFGLFRAAELPEILLASDAVAASVLRGGCTGIVFEDVETACVPGGPARRRGVSGVEELSDVVLSRHGVTFGAPDEAVRRAREEAVAAHRDPAATAHLRRGKT